VIAAAPILPPLERGAPTVEVGGVPVARLGFDATLALLGRWLDEPTPRRVATANLDFLYLAANDPTLRRALRTADLVTPDGAPLLWLARAAGRPCDGRVAGSDLVPALARVAAARGRSVFLLGGAPGSAAPAAAALARLAPGLRIAGWAAPRISLEDDASCAAAADLVRAARADIVLVALGCPKQDVFLARWLGRTGARLGIGVGGTFEMLSGRVRRAPAFLGPLGLEWLFRLAMEPRRLFGRYVRDALHLARLARAVIGLRAGSV